MQKTITIDGIDTPIILARRKGAKSLRISIKSDGTIRLAVPYGVPEFLAKKFVADRAEWITKHHNPQKLLQAGMRIGKHHTIILRGTDSKRSSTKITDDQVIVHIPRPVDVTSAETQKIIRSACEKALLSESKQLLPQRLRAIAEKHAVDYSNVQVKKMKSRWGMCDNLNNITLNTYLIQLDWHLIDYVICHELAHTKHHHHQASFWTLVEQLYPDYKNVRKVLKSTATDIIPSA